MEKIWRFFGLFYLFYFSKKICNRLSNTKIISEFNATLATVLTKKGWKNFKKCYNFMLYAFHATNVFPSLLRTVSIYSVRIPFILWEFHALKFELLVKKRDVAIKTMQIFFSFEDLPFFRLMQFMFLKVFFLVPSASWEIHLLFAQLRLHVHLSSLKPGCFFCLY